MQNLTASSMETGSAMPAVGRRTVVQGGSAALWAAFTGPLAALATRTAEAAGCVPATASVAARSPYGPLAPVRDLTTGLALIQLPADFSYRSYGWAGDLMSDTLETPPNHDGMGVVRERKTSRGTELVLVRNHERVTGARARDVIGFAKADLPKYDIGTTQGKYMLGGTTNLVYRDGRWVGSYASLGGTCGNCAGGATSWGSWLSNEEVLSADVSTTGRRHGYVFEVAADPGAGAPVTPIVGMGRMQHEACALDLDTGDWYMTEDQKDANTLYRFRPRRGSGALGGLHQGGVLQALRVRGVRNADLRMPRLCQEYPVEWVDIAAPDMDGGKLASVAGSVQASGPYLQAYAAGAAVFGACEGCWVAKGVVFFTDKQVAKGPNRAGRIWALDIKSMVLRAVFVSNDVTVGNSPDNLCVSPRGGVLFCEDGVPSGFDARGGTVQVPAQRLMVLRPDGTAYPFASNDYNFTLAQLTAAGKPNGVVGDQRNSEWAGTVFSPDGTTLFANLYGPGLTLAITGPWDRGTL